MFGRRIAHSFEADGLITAVRLGDGQAAGACPVARAWFDHHVPVTFHGTFV